MNVRKHIWERMVLDFKGGALRHRIAGRLKRAAQAWRLARGRLTVEDAQDLYLEITECAGWRPLVCLDNEGLLDRLEEDYEIDDRLREYADQAAAYVASKWSDSGEIRSSAVDWAIDCVLERATREGASLLERQPQTSEIEAEESTDA